MAMADFCVASREEDQDGILQLVEPGLGAVLAAMLSLLQAVREHLRNASKSERRHHSDAHTSGDLSDTDLFLVHDKAWATSNRCSSSRDLPWLTQVWTASRVQKRKTFSKRFDPCMPEATFICVTPAIEFSTHRPLKQAGRDSELEIVWNVLSTL